MGLNDALTAAALLQEQLCPANFDQVYMVCQRGAYWEKL